MVTPADPPSTNDFQAGLPNTAERTRAEHHVEGVRLQGGLFVEAVRRTRMPMMVTDATLPGNPITFANAAFVELSGYSMEELLGQDPHFMNGEGTDPEAVGRYTRAIEEGRDENLEIVQYRKDGTAFRAMLYASPIDDGQGRVINHFLSYLDITRRWQAEESLRALTSELEARVAARTADVEAANAKLSELLAERELLVVEVNHRAKNSLAVAAALLEVQARQHEDPAVRGMLEQSLERLHAMARVHDLLSKSESAQRIQLATYVSQLCDALGGISDHGQVRLIAEVEAGLSLDADTAFPVGIILTELITNALKYAFPGERAGAITTQAQRLADQQVELVVADDGVGMAQLREGSLGYGLVRSLVRQLKGRLDVDSGVGVKVVITFPTKD